MKKTFRTSSIKTRNKVAAVQELLTQGSSLTDALKAKKLDAGSWYRYRKISQTQPKRTYRRRSVTQTVLPSIKGSITMSSTENGSRIMAFYGPAQEVYQLVRQLTN